MATLDDFRTINQFQSTHPVRGATAAGAFLRDFSGNFNPRTP